MDERHSVELQADVAAPRERVYPLFATRDGLASWLDDAEFEPRVGATIHLRLAGATATGRILAVDPPQHLSLAFDWEGATLGAPTVLAFDAIDHGSRTYLTLRHVGLPGRGQQELHDALWRYWFGRLVRAAEAGPRESAPEARSSAR